MYASVFVSDQGDSMREPPDTPAPLEERLRNLPPSSKLVFKTLQYEGDLTQKELIETTRLGQRTVRDALARLEDCGIVSSRISFADARQRIYTLAPAIAETSPERRR